MWFFRVEFTLLGDVQFDGLADFEIAGIDHADVGDAIADLDGLLDGETAVFPLDHAGVADLTARLGVEARFVQNEGDLAGVGADAAFRVEFVVGDPTEDFCPPRRGRSTWGGRRFPEGRPGP